jgi:hypothetical protein
MDITAYLAEIEHAAREAIALVWAEHREVEELRRLVDRLTHEMEDGYRRAAAWSDSYDPDDVMLAAGIHWETYFGADKQRHGAQGELDIAADRLAAREFSRASMSGSLLQYAKQGISITHGELAACPEGRPIGRQLLKQVIWQGRNQALHWEDGNPHPPVRRCFDMLAADFGQAFAGYTAQNLAFEVVRLLGWESYEVFSRDLRSLA